MYRQKRAIGFRTRLGTAASLRRMGGLATSFARGFRLAKSAMWPSTSAAVFKSTSVSRSSCALASSSRGTGNVERAQSLTDSAKLLCNCEFNFEGCDMQLDEHDSCNNILGGRGFRPSKARRG